MIELITVMIVIGILSALGVSRFFSRETFDAKEYADQAKAVMRYAQKLAIAQNRPIYVSATADRFAACTAANCGVSALVPAPGGSNSGGTETQAQCLAGGNYISNWMCEGRLSSVSVASSRTTEAGAASSYFIFDSMGRPYNKADTVAAAGQPSTSTFSQALTLTFSGAGVSYTVTVEPETGYVH